MKKLSVCLSVSALLSLLAFSSVVIAQEEPALKKTLQTSSHKELFLYSDQSSHVNYKKPVIKLQLPPPTTLRDGQFFISQDRKTLVVLANKKTLEKLKKLNAFHDKDSSTKAEVLTDSTGRKAVVLYDRAMVHPASSSFSVVKEPTSQKNFSRRFIPYLSPTDQALLAEMNNTPSPYPWEQYAQKLEAADGYN